MAEIGVDISKAREILYSGELVAIPTETVYGLSGNALDQGAISKIYEVKDRPYFDPLIVHVGSIEGLSQLCREVPPTANKLAQELWPGPLTLVLPKKSLVPDLLTAGLDTVAVRMPNHPLTLNLLNILSFPLAAPSANPFGYISPTSPWHVKTHLGEKISYILDGGECSVGVESTILDFKGDKPRILRQGGITAEQLKNITDLDEISIVKHSNKTLAPGMLSSHYAPGKTLILGDIEALLKSHEGRTVGILSFTRIFEDVPPYLQIQLSKRGNLNEAAQNLFAALRKLDEMPISHILAEPVPEEGIGRAINDRLQRAAV